MKEKKIIDEKYETSKSTFNNSDTYIDTPSNI